MLARGWLYKDHINPHQAEQVAEFMMEDDDTTYHCHINRILALRFDGRERIMVEVEYDLRDGMAWATIVKELVA